MVANYALESLLLLTNIEIPLLLFAQRAPSKLVRTEQTFKVRRNIRYTKSCFFTKSCFYSKLLFQVSTQKLLVRAKRCCSAHLLSC